MNQFASDPSFLAAHLRPLAFRFQSPGGKTVDFTSADGSNVSGYFVPGKPKEGTLLSALRHDGLVKMPPKDRLPDAVVAEVLALEGFVSGRSVTLR